MWKNVASILNESAGTPWLDNTSYLCSDWLTGATLLAGQNTRKCTAELEHKHGCRQLTVWSSRDNRDIQLISLGWYTTRGGSTVLESKAVQAQKHWMAAPSYYPLYHTLYIRWDINKLGKDFDNQAHAWALLAQWFHLVIIKNNWSPSSAASKTEQHQDTQFMFCQDHEHDFHRKLVCQEISFQMQNCYTCYAGETSGSEENESESNASEMYEG